MFTEILKSDQKTSMPAKDIETSSIHIDQILVKYDGDDIVFTVYLV